MNNSPFDVPFSGAGRTHPGSTNRTAPPGFQSNDGAADFDWGRFGYHQPADVNAGNLRALEQQNSPAVLLVDYGRKDPSCTRASPQYSHAPPKRLAYTALDLQHDSWVYGTGYECAYPTEHAIQDLSNDFGGARHGTNFGFEYPCPDACRSQRMSPFESPTTFAYNTILEIPPAEESYHASREAPSAAPRSILAAPLSAVPSSSSIPNPGLALTGQEIKRARAKTSVKNFDGRWCCMYAYAGIPCENNGGKGYSSLYNKQRHEKDKHTNVKYVCSSCAHPFQDSTSLTRHLKNSTCRI
ncbi:hypothetical protein CYLTODRAFT_455412 [Cylindrobasidium torrendii FP15055 ss-10]|uniref:C2H2-type domain-containing protein n=1 Tax=Cylindrobasidium torrendii FP15055 ss-10 TaxID=1314674 RepID=A0A0D7B872_9AGAR|nr:hypothetical protein CYLTODRAFT_455412 [Cylindrobasidium torrendii FP15055 ss-10]